MADGAPEALSRVPGPSRGAGPDVLTLPVGVGRRVLVVANLHLGPQATPASTWAASGLARALDTWTGPGLVVVAGNLFDLGDGPGATGRAQQALGAHGRLAEALTAFAAGEDRRLVCIPGSSDAALCVAGLED
ncbi:MAG: hypothetical protein ACYDB3_03125, partial [Acidimicrobiales bacterium]